MSTRLATGGRLIDRAQPVGFTFDGRPMVGLAGDTLASALMANDQILMGRSFKYHRPRGPIAAGPEEPNALMTLGEGGRAEPNQRATVTELFDGLVAASQNHWPSLGFDLGAAANAFARFLPAGFYYKTFIHPRWAWKHLFEPVIRKSAGLGRAPQDRDADTYEHFHTHVDVLVVGGGIAGLQAARSAAATGASVLLVEQAGHWGGRAPVDGAEIDGMAAADWIRLAVQGLESTAKCPLAAANGRGRALRPRLCAGGRAGRRPQPRRRPSAAAGVEDSRPPRGHRHRRHRAPAGLCGQRSAGCDAGLGGARLRGQLGGVARRPHGDRDQQRRRLPHRDHADRGRADRAGDPRRPPGGRRPAGRARPGTGIRVETGKGVAKVIGTSHVTGVGVCVQAGEGAVLETIGCDAVAMSGGWSPTVHLWSHAGGKLIWSEPQAQFQPDPARPPLGADGAAVATAAGAAAGAMTTDEALRSAYAAGRAAAQGAGFKPGRPGAAPQAAPEPAQAMLPVWIMPQGAGPALRAKMWLDFQNDVKVSDVQLAAQEGYVSVEHAKRYTTLGMATDQGKLSNINGLAVLAEALHDRIPAVGTTTFRPPWTPVTMGAVAGEARAALFQPLRKTPLHAWHEAHGADFEPVGQWRRPYAFRRPGETRAAAVEREVKNTRQALGLLDASTLGKILVKGPDAGRFLDMLYTGMISTIPVGRCRYGLMCTENGFLTDDGVVARLAEDTWLCHTTTGGADRIHAHMEDWLQCEWWDWKVWTANLTEQYAQIAVVGPNARKLLEAIGGRRRVEGSDAVHGLGRRHAGQPAGPDIPHLVSPANSATRSQLRPVTVWTCGRNSTRPGWNSVPCPTAPRPCT